MLYMVIETYRHGPAPVYARASEHGRMLPPGLVYVESWVDKRGLDRCFQLMETEQADLFDKWIANWSDLVEFEIVACHRLGRRRRPHRWLIRVRAMFLVIASDPVSFACSHWDSVSSGPGRNRLRVKPREQTR